MPRAGIIAQINFATCPACRVDIDRPVGKESGGALKSLEAALLRREKKNFKASWRLDFLGQGAPRGPRALRQSFLAVTQVRDRYMFVSILGQMHGAVGARTGSTERDERRGLPIGSAPLASASRSRAHRRTFQRCPPTLHRGTLSAIRSRGCCNLTISTRATRKSKLGRKSVEDNPFPDAFVLLFLEENSKKKTMG